VAGLRLNRWGKARGDGVCHPLAWHMLDVAAILDTGLERRPALWSFMADTLGMERGEVRAMLLTVLALHDIGKVAIGFQALSPSAAGRMGLSLTGREDYRWGHDLIGQTVLAELIEMRALELCLPAGPEDWILLHLLFGVSTGHHGRLPVTLPELSDLKRARCCTSADLDAAAELVRVMAALFGWRSGLPDGEGLKRLSPLLNGIFTLCDWLGSADIFTYCEKALEPGDYYEHHALVHAREVLDEIRPAIFQQLPPRPPATFAALFAHLGRDGGPSRPNPLQALVDRLFTADALPDGPLLTVIEDLPGSGKTEAGDLIVQRLVALGRADGSYIGLPTMATADAAFERKFDDASNISFGSRIFEGTPQIILAHSRKHRHRRFRFTPTQAGVEEGEGHASAWFGRSSRRALLTELGVGTIDQALAGALRARHATVRLVGLWRKVLLIDEVHAYDDYMRALLESLLRWQGMMGDPVVLMSATLPSSIRRTLVQAYAEGAGWPDVSAMADRAKPGAYPLLTLVSQQGIAQHPLPPMPGPGTRPVRFEAVHEEETVDARIAEWLAVGRSVIWFRNTVEDAVATWERHLDQARAMSRPEPLLYHARFLPGDRAVAEAALLGAIGKRASPENRCGRLVIATQAAEQSLDLDADEMITDLAPADAVVQRLGRRRRHPRATDGELAADGIDLRPDSPVLLHMPRLEQVDSRWYARKFPKSAGIYDNDARLWLSARLLLQPEHIAGRNRSAPGLVLADHVRPLLEAVYADPPDAPDVLRSRHDAAMGDDQAERQQGLRARFTFRKGVIEDAAANNSLPDDRDGEPRTRLIDGHTVVMAVIEDGTPRLLVHWNPICDEGHEERTAAFEPIEASECRSPMLLEPLPEQSSFIELLKARLPAQQVRALDRRSIVFLDVRQDEVWRGEAVTPDRPNGKSRVRVSYCPRRGLRLRGAASRS
jgi:CRISPR-associated endonuclease/helicase Cas3